MQQLPSPREPEPAAWSRSTEYIVLAVPAATCCYIRIIVPQITCYVKTVPETWLSRVRTHNQSGSLSGHQHTIRAALCRTVSSSEARHVTTVSTHTTL